MAVEQVERAERPTSSIIPFGAALWFAVIALMGVSFVGGQLVPYLVNGLHHVPLAEIASGRHDPKDLWPNTAGAPFDMLLVLGWLFMLVGAPLCLISSVASPIVIRFTWRTAGRTERVLIVATFVLGLSLLIVAVSPFGHALNTWLLD